MDRIWYLATLAVGLALYFGAGAITAHTVATNARFGGRLTRALSLHLFDLLRFFGVLFVIVSVSYLLAPFGSILVLALLIAYVIRSRHKPTVGFRRAFPTDLARPFRRGKTSDGDPKP